MENLTGGTAKRNRKAGNGVSSSPVPHFPLAIWLQIFLKLPILAVIRCKSVCKPWYNLISDPFFFTNYTKTPRFTTVIVSSPYLSSTGRVVLSLLEVSGDGVPIRTPVPVMNLPNYTSEEGPSQVWLMDSCNGFICVNHSIHSIHTIYVCNPLTGECTSLPQWKLENGLIIVNYKLGFSPSINKFKVFRFAHNGFGVGVIDIFTVGTDSSWRRFTSSNARFGMGNIVALRGVLHWIVDFERPLSIFTFELDEEKVGPRISVPPGLVQDGRCLYLTTLDNCLFIGDSFVASRLILWKMSEYGVGESWTKQFILTVFFPSRLRVKSLVAVTTLPNGAIVFALGEKSSLVAYNPKRKTWFEIRAPGRTIVSADIVPYEPVFSPVERLNRVL